MSAFHPAVVLAGNEAFGAWSRAREWASAFRARVVPTNVARLIARPRTWAQMVEAGFALRTLEGWELLDPLTLAVAPSDAPAEETDGHDTTDAKRRAGRLGGLRRAELAKQNVKQNVGGASSTGQAYPVATPLADPDPDPEISEKYQRRSPSLVPPKPGDLAKPGGGPAKYSPKKSRRRPEKVDINPDLLTARERAAYDAIRRDPDLVATVRWPADTASDLAKRAPAVRDLAVEVHKAGQWLRDKQASRPNGRMYLQNWMDTAQREAPPEGAGAVRDTAANERPRHRTMQEIYGDGGQPS